MRKNADELFDKLFVTAIETAKDVGVEISVPPRGGRQQYRDKYEGVPLQFGPTENEST